MSSLSLPGSVGSLQFLLIDGAWFSKDLIVILRALMGEGNEHCVCVCVCVCVCLCRD